MYRNIAYYVGPDKLGYIYLSTWDENGHRIEKHIQHNSQLYRPHPNGETTSIDGVKLTKKEFPNVWERKKFVETCSDKLYNLLKAEREYLVNQYFQDNDSEEFTQHPLRIYFYDIEVAVPIGADFPHPAKAEHPINVMTFYDTLEEKYHIFVSTKDDVNFKNTKNVKYYLFGNERAMLEAWLNWFERYRPDVLSGWNTDNFDNPYLINRLKFNFDDEFINTKLSPIGKVYQKFNMDKGKGVSRYIICGITQLDYLFLYRDKFSDGPKDSYKLDAIGELEVGFGKMEIPTNTLAEFWVQDIEKFVEYNRIDVEVLVELNKKCRFIDLSRQLCYIGLTEFESIYSTNPYIYGAIVIEAKRKYLCVLSTDQKENHEESYPGAYVFPPKVGCYRDTIFTVDFNSLYPSIMMMLNMSPETKIGKIISVDNNEINILNNYGKIKTVPKESFKKMLQNQDISISANKILFINPSKKKGLCAEFLEKTYEKRKFWKKKMGDTETEMHKVTDQIKSKSGDIKLLKQQRLELETQVSQYNCLQLALKTVLNSLYGLFGNRFFPLYDLDIASAITLTGQSIIKHMANEISNYINTNYTDDSTEQRVIYGDTDSCMVDSGPIANKILGCSRDLDDNQIKLLSKEVDTSVEVFNDLCFVYTKKQFNSPLRRIIFSREKTCANAIFLTKKKYILNIRDNEGFICNSFKYSGVDIKKKEISKQTREKLEYIINEGITRIVGPTEYLQLIEKLWDEYKLMPLDDICFTKNYGQYKGVEGGLDFQSAKGAGVHARAAIYYNGLLKRLNLNDKYDKLDSGGGFNSRLKYVYILKMNDYGFDVIGWKSDYMFPPEFEKCGIQADRFMMFTKTVLAPLKRFIQIFGWPDFNPNAIPEVDLFSL